MDEPMLLHSNMSISPMRVAALTAIVQDVPILNVGGTTGD